MFSARLVADIVRTSFGPRGLDKMFIDNLGAVHATNDGATILKKSVSSHPIARIITELAKVVDQEVGDGTTSAVILMSALLEQAVQLADRGVHPATITNGYSVALAKALSDLREMAEHVLPDSKEWLVKVAATSIQTKLVAKGAKDLPELMASAAMQVAEKQGDGYKLDTSKITVRSMPGGSLADTRLIQGMVLPKGLIDPSMPKRLENVKIAVGDVSLVIKKTIFDAKVTISDPKMVGKLGAVRRAELKKMGDGVIATGANVLVNREGIDDLVANQFANAGMMAVRHAKIGDVANLAKATGATVVNGRTDISSDDLGFAALIEERKVEGVNFGDRWLFVEGCKDPKALTLLLRGGNWYVVDEAERSINNALMAMKMLMERPAVVAGGGAVEVELASRVMDWSRTIEGREQVAAEAFAIALEEIPKALATNAGMDAINAMTELRSRHAQGGKWFGIDATEAKVKDMYSTQVFEPLAVKEEVLKAATETACLIIRTDAVIQRPKDVPRTRKRPPVLTSKEKEEFAERVQKPPRRVDRRYHPAPPRYRA
jgi:archaeal chaperonin